MKAILISIRPKWVELILNFIKKDEIRKGTAIGKAINRLIKEQGVAPMLIYCTKKDSLGRIKDIPHDRYFVDCVDTPQDFEKMDSGYDGKGKVVARFNATAEEIICRPICGEWECYTKTQGYSEIAKASCLKNKEIVHYLKGKNGTAIHINDLEIFDRPRELCEFHTNIKKEPPEELLCPECGKPMEYYEYKYLTKAPQSWCYIEAD